MHDIGGGDISQFLNNAEKMILWKPVNRSNGHPTRLYEELQRIVADQHLNYIIIIIIIMIMTKMIVVLTSTQGSCPSAAAR